MYLEKALSKKKKSFPKPKDVSIELEKFFGRNSTRIEKLIIVILFAKIGLEYKHEEEYDFEQLAKLTDKIQKPKDKKG